MFGTCRECGFVHPPTPGGCPLAKENQLKDQVAYLENEKIANFSIQIREELLKKLEALNNEDQRIKFTEKILAFIRAE